MDSGAQRAARPKLVALIATACLLMLVAFAGTARADFGIVDFDGALLDADNTTVTQAGAHPYVATTSFDFKTKSTPDGVDTADGSAKNLTFALPVGFVGNPSVVPVCSATRIAAGWFGSCPSNSQVGVINVRWHQGGFPVSFDIPVAMLDAPPGVPAQLGFNFLGQVLHMNARVRAGQDYGLSIDITELSQSIGLTGSTLKLWGVPADPRHDPERTCGDGLVSGCSAGIAPKPLLTLPTSCAGPQTTTLTANSWQLPEAVQTASFVSHDEDDKPVGTTGCDKLPFTPTVAAAPTTAQPDAPSGLEVQIDSPQNLDNPNGLATAHLKDVKVTLPEGMTINPGSANGLGACSDDQLGLRSADAPSCPDSAKIGTVTAKTPLLSEELTGGVYLRTQASDDPESGDMFRMALVLENKDRGILVKLPGAIRVDKDTGRIVTEFDNNPQLPVEQIKLSLKSGPRAPLATPPTCGSKSIDAELTSWAGQQVHTSTSFDVACTSGLGAFSPAFEAGTVSPIGGAFSPFAVSIAKPDGNADLTGLSMSLPVGLLASLKGNIGTQVGTVAAFAGPGSKPYALPGKVFLEGQYGDAPFSLRVVVPAVAGPFTLGTVEVRQKLFIDPVTAQATVVSDPLPTIVKGVPVRLQRLEVNVDKPGFVINPTSCAPKTVSGTLSSAVGQSVAVTNRFQVGDCASLALKPELGLSLSGKGQNRDGGHPAISATLTQPQGGQANLKKVRVTLPLSLALDPDNSDSDALCSFAEGSKPDPKCPASSIVGKATAVSPILNEPLSGPVYFVKNERKDPKSGRSIKTTPKLVLPLVGENGLKLTLTGASDVVDDRLVTTFDNIPDAQVSSFKMDINGGKKGILVVSGDKIDICAATQVADQQITGQNNKAANTGIAIQTPSCPLKVLSKKVGKTSVAIKVGGLGAGKVTVSGKGIKKTSKRIAKSTVATITAKRTKGKPGKVTVSFDPAGPAKARKTTK